MIRVLVVGQTPPPLGGQAVMIQKLLEGDYSRVTLYHVRMAFSRDMGEIGNVRLGKITHLLSVIARVFVARIRYRTTVLYYPPGGPERTPFVRDMIILLATRWMFAHTVFHFHAGGVSAFVGGLGPFQRWLARRAYGRPECAIRPSALNPPDGASFGAVRDVVIPHGLEDHYPEHGARKADPGRESTLLLFVGVLRPTKGVMVLIEACKLLKESGLKFRLDLMGQFFTPEFEREVCEALEAWGLSDQVCFLGVRSGDDKWRAFNEADILCFPSFFESESFGLVVLEGMQFALPVVATRWRGIPSLVREGETGYLVPHQDASTLAERLARLIQNPDMRRTMGEKGRDVFLQEFQIERWRRDMENEFVETVEGTR